MKLASLFDGIAGFPLAGTRHGITPVWASEIEKAPIAVSKARLPEMKHYGSVCDIKGSEVEPVDIITFGSPCQDLSVAGKRAGMGEGTRSGLFSEAVRIIKEMRSVNHLRNTNDVGSECGEGNNAAIESGSTQHGVHSNNGGENARRAVYPRYAVWENVPGAFSSNHGEDFRAVIESLAKIAEETVSIPLPKDGKWEPAGLVEGDGWSIAWRTLDAQFWGVPQRRKRIFLVADFGGRCASEIFFEREGVSGDITESGSAREEVTGGVERGIDKAICFVIRGGCEGGGKGYLGSEEKALTLDTVGAQKVFQPICVHATQDPITAENRTHALGANSSQAVYEWHNQDSRITGPIETAKTLNTNASGREGHLVSYIPETSPTIASKWAKGTGGPSGDECQNLVVPNQTVRRLTPTECSRLQGYPDGWCDVEGISDSAKYKMLGNSVAIPCVEFILGCIARVYEIL